jgi:hypothetical protein
MEAAAAATQLARYRTAVAHKTYKIPPLFIAPTTDLQASNNWRVTFAHVIHLDYSTTPF